MGVEVCKMVSGLERGTEQVLTVCPRAGTTDYSREWARGRFKRNRGRQLFTWGPPCQGTWWAQGNFLESELGFQSKKVGKFWKMRMARGSECTPGCSTNINLSLQGVCCSPIWRYQGWCWWILSLHPLRLFIFDSPGQLVEQDHQGYRVACEIALKSLDWNLYTSMCLQINIFGKCQQKDSNSF